MNLQSSTVVNMYFCKECDSFVERGCVKHQFPYDMGDGKAKTGWAWQRHFPDRAGFFVDWNEIQFKPTNLPTA